MKVRASRVAVGHVAGAPGSDLALIDEDGRTVSGLSAADIAARIRERPLDVWSLDGIRGPFGETCRAGWYPDKLVPGGLGIGSAEGGGSSWHDAWDLLRLSAPDALRWLTLPNTAEGSAAAAWEVLDRSAALQEEVGVPWSRTAGGAALQLLRRVDLHTWNALQRNEITPDEYGRARACVRPARTEVRYVGRLGCSVGVFDLRSAYPSLSFQGQGLPLGADPSDSTDVEDSAPWSDWCFWSQRGADPVKWAVELGANGAGTGELKAYLTRDDARWLQSKGLVVRRAGRGVVAREWLDAFASSWFAHLFPKRADTTVGPLIKAWLNTLHGKLQDSPNRIHRVLEQDAGGPRYRTVLEPWRRACWRQPLAAAWVQGRCRVALSEAALRVESAGGRVVYADTDSIHVAPCPRPEAYAAVLATTPQGFGRGPGQWTLQYTAGDAEYGGRKWYRLIDAVQPGRDAEPRDIIRAAGLERAQHSLDAWSRMRPLGDQSVGMRQAVPSDQGEGDADPRLRNRAVRFRTLEAGQKTGMLSYFDEQ